MLAGNGCDAELWQFSQQLYPDLPPIEAYLALHRDYVAPLVGPAIKGTLTIGLIYARLRNPNSLLTRLEGAELCVQGVERLYSYIKSLSTASQSMVSNITADKNEISAQLTAEIWQRYKAGTLGQPNPLIDGVEMAAASASVPGASGKNIPKEATGNTSAASANSGPAEYHPDYLEYSLANDPDCSGGAGGPEGFAQPVYDLVKMKINKLNAADRENHRFFIYHNPNNWHPTFHRLTSEKPLPPEFINNPCDDLDHACLFMREVRQKLLAKDEKCGKDITFHLLIPSWSKLQIKKPLHFPEDLYPLQVEGLKHGGESQVVLNLPAAPAGLLHVSPKSSRAQLF